MAKLKEIVITSTATTQCLPSLLMSRLKVSDDDESSYAATISPRCLASYPHPTTVQAMIWYKFLPSALVCMYNIIHFCLPTLREFEI